MKKKCVTALVLAAALACVPATAFGANSLRPSGGGGGGSSHGSSTSSGVTIVAGSGQKVETSTTVTAGGSSTVVGDTAVSYATGVAATAGLPETAVAAINGINEGKALSDVVKDVDVSGYKALTSTNAIITKDAATGTVKTGAVEVTLYVPNLVDGLQNVSVLFYDNVTGKWTLLPVTKVDPATKTVVTTVTGSGTYTVVYK